jgi:hypothetical protein
MRNISDQIEKALARNEVRAERIANRVRLAFLALVTVVAGLNLRTVLGNANLINFAALGLAYLFGLAVFLTLKRDAYRPAMKYVTSFLDVTLVCLVLLFYTTVEIPSVALKNPAFLLVFPLIALTAFRHDPKLTAFTGGYAVLLYGCLLAYVWQHTTIRWGDYWAELFTPEVTGVGQATKILILVVYVGVVTFLARDTRAFLHKLVRKEVLLRSRAEAIERELELASLVQAQLLPRPQPPVGGLHLHGTILPGRYVGGDYYDFIRRSDTTLLLIVADVSGKGIPAALIMSAFRASVHLFSSMNLSLEELMHRLNAQVYESTSSSSYVTLFLAEIDTAGNSITYINAGHPPPILHLNGQINLLDRGTAPVGMFPKLPSFRAATENYFPGTTLVACTDGVWERSSTAGELFGERGLREFVMENATTEGVAFCQRLSEQVRQFGENLPLEDDATLVVARFGVAGGW